MSEDNVAVLRKTYDAFGRGDIPAVMNSFAKDITWHTPAVLPQAGDDAKGHEGVGEFFGRLAATWEDLQLEFNTFVASGDRVCVLGRADGKLDGTQTGYGFVHCWTMRDGVCTDFTEFVDPDPEMLGR